ncbi:Down syndrome cell adhesion molecule [Amphibalanus amphitrite]|uniref:Down syndrome cell adhesion molecule n=1 Tax=Amphibalanus amphitrite TaxID=1232801 RepID=A0A6A4UZE6_AMPAM|nr:Down syndrome cell adhesion molecule [Amphibalanus amphitrite]
MVCSAGDGTRHVHRRVTAAGSLLYLPFGSEAYRRDVHAAVVRCRAANAAGAVLSRDVTVRAVVTQPFAVRLADVTVTAGNAAVFQCRVGGSAASHVTDFSWLVGGRPVTGSRSALSSPRLPLQLGPLVKLTEL